MVAQGWVSLKQQQHHSDSTTDSNTADLYSELVALNAAAKASNLGIYTSDEVAKKQAIRSVDWNTDATKYFETLLASRTTPLSASSPIILDVVIEHVRDGASFRCYVIRDSCYVSFAFAGATCPRVNTPSSSATATTAAADGATTTTTGSDNNAAGTAGPEPFAVQSKLFTELRLLNRRLEVVSV